MDKRISYKIVLDTETCPMDKTIKGVDPYNMLVYDIGWAIVDKRGKVYKTQSFVNSDIFLDEKDLMKSAYYSNKIPNYWNDIKNGKRILTSFYNIRKALINDIKEFQVTQIFAHNMNFDLKSLNTTQRYLTKSKYRYFFPRDMEICDTLAMARSVIQNKPTYKKFCKEILGLKRVSVSAETIYKFLTNDLEFVESHTGLEDVMIEKEILAYCYRQHKKMKRLLYEKK